MKSIDDITAALRRGESVTIREFGIFSVVETPARMGRNPGTGEAIQIKAGRKVKFKASKSLL
jgi:DNA-binding protein HU-beta